MKSELCELKSSKITKATVKDLKLQIKQQDLLISSLKSKIKIKNAALKVSRLRVSRSDRKIQKLKRDVTILETTNNELQETNDDLTVRLEEIQRNFRDVTEERDYLNEIVNNEENTVNFYDKDAGKYSFELRTCIYTLLGLNVAASNIAPVIKCVLNLANKEVQKLPSRTTILNMNVERLVLSQKQLNEKLVNEPNLTLYTDETTKFGTKYSGYHVSDSGQNTYVLGMREIVTKSGSDTLAAFQQILADIEDRASDADDAAKRVLVNISATMSDRASTEKKFNSLLEELRASVLPDLNDHWDDLSPANQTAASGMLNFFCGLHGLVHFAECSNKSAIEVQNGLLDELQIFDKSFRKVSESGALRLTRTVCKALARGADEKNGKYSEFNLFTKDFLREQNMLSLPLTPFKGNRFNILFESSAAVFFLREKVREFLLSNQSNNLLKSVLFDLNVTEYLAGVKAFGLISRFVTGPLWSLLEDKSVHVYDMNEHYLELIIFLHEAVENINSFMRGETELFNAVHKDAIYQSLIEEWEHDDIVIVYLQVMLPAMAECGKKLYADDLPGGKWEEVTQEMRQKAISVQKHNKFAESVFGYLDNLLRKKPNISALASEAYIMFTANKTDQWIDSKSDQQKQMLVNEAVKEGVVVKENFKRRKAEIHELQKAAMAERARLAEEKEARRVQRMTTYTCDIIHFGLWQSEDGVDSALREIKNKTEKIEALKAQLNFRKKVLKQNPSDEDMKNVYRMSQKVNGRNRKLTVDELSENIKKLIKHAFTIEPDTQHETEPRLALLSGKTVRHKFTTDGHETWWKGSVISQVPGYPTWFNIVYEGDIAVYTFELLKDYEEGDLQLILN